MSEKNCKVKQGENVKRFSWKTEKLQHSDDEVLLVVDSENKEWKGHILNIVDLLNTQQAKIQSLKEELKLEQDFASRWQKESEMLAKENEQLKEEIRAYPINEQYAEEIMQQNQKLRIERNDLRRENEQLREELSECEKFRYSVFKRIEKTIEDRDNCVLNKDAKFPCKDYDECLKRQGNNKPLPCVVNWMMGRPFGNMIRKEGDDE